MSIQIQNQLTAAAYPNDQARTGTILGPSTLGFKLQIIVGNAPCLIQVATVMDKNAGPQAGYQWTDDIPIVAGSGQTVQQSFDGAVGFRAKDLIPGTHATVYAVVWERGDPIPTDPLAASGVLSGAGIVPPTPPASTLNIQHNDALVAIQPTLDFVDGAITWSVVNDGANTRVKVTGTNPLFTTSAWSGGPPGSPTNGDYWIATGVGSQNEAWMFQYNSSEPTAPWKFVGGPPVTWVNFSGTAVADSAWHQMGGNFTMRQGVYEVDSSAWVVNGVNANAVFNIGYGINGANPGGAQSATQIYTGSAHVSLAVPILIYGASAGQTIGAFYIMNGGANGSIQVATSSIQPIKVL